MILPDRWRNPHKGPVLKPASLPNSLYWACWVWTRSHQQWKSPLNWDPTIGAVCRENLCASENDNWTRQGQTPKRERWWLTYWTANGELPSGRLAPRAWPSPPPGPERPANLTGGPRWTPVEEYGGRAKRFQGAPRREQFLEIGVGAFQLTRVVEWDCSEGESSRDVTKVLHGPWTQTYGKTNNSWQVFKC